MPTTYTTGQLLRRYRPREAAVAIVNYVNHRNTNVAMLALNVPTTKSPQYTTS